MIHIAKRFLITAILCIPLLSTAQDRLMGLVVEVGKDGKDAPLPGANVYWLGTTSGTVTGNNGVFLIPRTKGNEKLVVSFVGYRTDTITVTGQTNVKVTLVSDNVLQEVTVEGWKPSSGLNYLKGINVIEMDEDELFKAACCNLSESFETNPSVDVAFTDAVTGTRQIQMLGLAGANIMTNVENMPGVRGIAANYGFGYIPGTWINAIQVTKGIGSVVNGYESIAGHINVELKKPQESEKLFLNGYINQSGRTELNLNVTERIGDKWAMTTLLHGDMRPIENDMNDDGFLDFPVASQINVINRWVFKGNNGWLGQFGVKALRDRKRGGELDYDEETDRNTTNRYGLEINSDRYEVWGKLGYMFTGKPYKSMGIQLSGLYHDMDSYFGFVDYDARQQSVYANFIYQSIISSTQHKFKTGLSYLLDDFDESLDNAAFLRTEHVTGSFFEYTYEYLDKFTLIAGARLDYNSLFEELYFTPRLHLRYSPLDGTVIRGSAGQGRRTANVIAENVGVLASSRQILFENATSDVGYGFRQDRAWNLGLNVSQDFTLNYRNGIIAVDLYHTDFSDQVILDLDRSPQEAVFSGLTGDSYSTSFQVQVDYEPVKRVDVRLAWRWLDVMVDYSSGLLRKPLVPENRAFVNVAYKTRNNWDFDYTLQWTGAQRIPDTSGNPETFRREEESPDFITMNTQVTKTLKKGWAVYLGIENLTNYRQDDPIIAADEPFSPWFDSSLVWGPIFGRMTYLGFRYRID